MHEMNIELLRDEAARLLELEADTLAKMIEEDGLLQPDGSGAEKQTITLTSAQETIQVLREEQDKLENLEMVLAVVGTMKSGKSTTINALVGMEIMPNRNRPMTTLPTLIRHVPGRKIPIARFDNSEPVNDLLGNLREALASQEYTDELDEDMIALLKNVRQGFVFERQHEGQKQVSQFLHNLNDLVRAVRAMGMEFPFSRYAGIHDFPVIEVEFAHLREMENVKGRLALLDTPGPNESGQAHLRQVLKQQLQRASGVIAVLDYTQLKSSADADLRRDVLEIADLAAGRLTVLVNKFDQNDCNSDSADKTKEFVVRDLMGKGGKLTVGNVFPVSSKRAYLANCARHALTTKNGLSSSEAASAGWVKDFGNEAFGLSGWKRKIGNADEVARACEDLWQESQYGKMLNEVIVRSHSRAALFAIEAALDKIRVNAKNMHNMLEIREGGLLQRVEDIQKSIGKLESDMQRIADCRQQAMDLAEETTESFNGAIEGALEDASSDISREMEKYFQEGKRKEEEAAKAVKAKQRERKESLFISSTINMLLDCSSQHCENNDRDFDPNRTIIKFDSPDDAQEMLKRVQSAVQGIFACQTEILRNKFGKCMEAFEKSFGSGVVGQSVMIIKDITKHFEDKGIAISLDGIQIKNIDFSSFGIVDFENIAREKKEKKRARREADGAFAWFQRKIDFFDNDWGYEYYDKEVIKHIVNIKAVRKRADAYLKSARVRLCDMVDAEVKKPLEAEIKAFFTVFENTVENLRGDMQQGIRDKKLGQEAQQQRLNALRKIKKKVDELSSDCKRLWKDIEKLKDAYDGNAAVSAPAMADGATLSHARQL